MGQTLSEPDTAKETAYCQNNLYKVGSSCMQGWRIHMEDSHTHILSLPDDPGTAFFAVYDGHGGAAVAEYAGKHLHKLVTKQPEYQEGNVEKALQNSFLEIDNIMQKEDAIMNGQVGSTAVAVLVKDNVLYCANVGDSRAIACINGAVEPLSFDHKPSNKLEYTRIVAAGGFVEYNRVNGNLALSRALGDYSFKRNTTMRPFQQIVIAYPDVEVRNITSDWEFIVLACDGIWDVMTNEEVVAFVRNHISKGLEPEEICEALMTKCLAPDCLMGGLGCDNMTVVIIALLHDKSYSELIEKCSTQYNNTNSDSVKKQDEEEDQQPDGEQQGDEETTKEEEVKVTDNCADVDAESAASQVNETEATETSVTAEACEEETTSDDNVK